MKLTERLRKFHTLEDSLVLSDLMQAGTSALADGTNLSMGMINKYLKFTMMKQTMLLSSINPEKVRMFITQMYDPPPESDIPNAHQIMSFMEQNEYEGESMDGLWMPVKFAAPLSGAAISEAIHYLEDYEPLVDRMQEDIQETQYIHEEIDITQLEDMMGDSAWLLTKSMIETDAIEGFMQEVEQAPLETVIIEATSAEWGDAINALTALSALVGSKKLTMEEAGAESESQAPRYDKEWDWMNPKDINQVVKHNKASMNRQKRSDDELDG